MLLLVITNNKILARSQDALTSCGQRALWEVEEYESQEETPWGNPAQHLSEHMTEIRISK